MGALADALVLLGCGLIVYATYLLSWIAALYVAGALLIIAGILAALAAKKEAK